MSGQIYLCFDGSGLWKIGITNDPKKRIRQLRTGNPTIRMQLNITVEYPAAVEIELHTKFGDKRVSGEWFDLEPEDLHYIYSKLLGDKNTHSLQDFVIVYDVINKQKKASDRDWLREIDRRFEDS